MATDKKIRSLIDAAYRHDVVLFPFGQDNELAMAFRTPPPAGLIEELYQHQGEIVAVLCKSRADREVSELDMQQR